MIQQSHCWGYTQKNVTQVTPEALAHPCLLQHYSQKPSYGNSQHVPLLTNGLRKCGIYTQWNFMQPWRMKSYHSQVNVWNWRTSFWVRLAWLKRPKIICSTSYADIRSRVNTKRGLDFDHMMKGEHTGGVHKGGMRTGKTPKKLHSICCPQCQEINEDNLKWQRPSGVGDQELEKRLFWEELI
jgi:hypothetical protein